jgi:hypothetical protein
MIFGDSASYIRSCTWLALCPTRSRSQRRRSRTTLPSQTSRRTVRVGPSWSDRGRTYSQTGSLRTGTLRKRHIWVTGEGEARGENTSLLLSPDLGRLKATGSQNIKKIAKKNQKCLKQVQITLWSVFSRSLAPKPKYWPDRLSISQFSVKTHF